MVRRFTSSHRSVCSLGEASRWGVVLRSLLPWGMRNATEILRLNRCLKVSQEEPEKHLMIAAGKALTTALKTNQQQLYVVAWTPTIL